MIYLAYSTAENNAARLRNLWSKKMPDDHITDYCYNQSFPQKKN